MRTEKVWHSPWCLIRREEPMVMLKDNADSMGATVRFTDAQVELIRNCGMRPAEVAMHMPPPRPKRRQVTLTDQDEAYIRSLGYDPAKVIAAMRATDATEYRPLTMEGAR